MAKNIPITARVSRGLFGQKATEPVLNVGQAGVYGNNVTKGDPSPAKMMMKSPLKQVKSESAGDLIPKGQDTVSKKYPSPAKMMTKSPLKQVKTSKGTGDLILEGQANVSTGSTGPDRVIKGTPAGTANVDKLKATYNKKMPPGWKPSEAENAAANKRLADAKAKDAASGTPDRIEKGENTKSTQPLRVFNEGSAKTSFWRRQDDRAVTHTSRKKKKADIQLAKLEAKEKGLEGKAKRDYISNAKTKAKKEMWESRQAGYKGSRDAAVLQGQQSARVHDKVIGVQVDPSKSQELPIERTVVGDAMKYKMHGQMNDRTFTGPESLTATTGENVNPATGKPAGGLSNTKSTDVEAAEAPKKEAPKKEEPKKDEVSTVTEKELSLDTDPVGMKTVKGFFAKKSPLKMKYFK